MRAIIECRTAADKEKLELVFKEIEWSPEIDWASDIERDQMIEKNKQEILSLVSPDDHDIVKVTYSFMGYHHTTRSWVLVNRPTRGLIEFRVRNRSPKELQKACANLVGSLQRFKSTDAKLSDLTFKFTNIIQVLEANSPHHAFYGEVVPPSKFQAAKQDRRNEWSVGKIALGIAIVLALATIPPIEMFLRNYFAANWVQWAIDNLARLATSAIVTSSVSFLNVIIHWFYLRRLGTIKWNLE